MTNSRSIYVAEKSRQGLSWPLPIPNVSPLHPFLGLIYTPSRGPALPALLLHNFPWDLPKEYIHSGFSPAQTLPCPHEWSEVAQSCPTLCDPIDCSLPGSSVHGIFQAIVLEWIAISFSRLRQKPKWKRVNFQLGFLWPPGGDVCIDLDKSTYWFWNCGSR